MLNSEPLKPPMNLTQNRSLVTSFSHDAHVTIHHLQVRVCDSCFDEHGPKTGPAGAGGVGGNSSSSENSSPVKTSTSSRGGKKQMSSATMDPDLPAEYLASSLAQQVG
jgi:hypothetical protein